MEWFTLVSAVVGALLGFGASTFNERLRWKRDRAKAHHENKVKLYGEYLASLATTRSELRLAARSESGGESARRSDADKAFTKANVYAGRYRIMISESDAVAGEGEAALRALRVLRDSIVAGERHRSEGYNEAKKGYEQHLRALIGEMKSDLAATR